MRHKVVFIPPYCGDEVKSDAERKMFEVLQDLDLKHAVILHSLGLPKHESKVYGEIDFVIICELGVACLEIKGGKVECRNGQWFFTNRYGNEFQKNEGPFAQVIGNMFSLKNIIKSKFNNTYHFNNMLIASGVIFPDIEFNSQGQEIIREIIYDENSLDITKYVIGVFDYWRDQKRSIPMKLTSQDVKEIVAYLRGDFLYQPTLGSRIEDVDRFLLKYTEEQKSVLKGLSGNRHLIIKGGAGTGKTLCALDYALRESQNGKKVLYLTFNKNLAHTIIQDIESNEGIKIINIHGLFGEFVTVDLEQLKDNSKYYFEEIMPEKFYEYLKALTKDELEENQFDIVVMDEAQDMLRANYLYCLDLLLKGGLDKGKWAIFYDEKQNLFNPQFEEGLEILESYEHTSFNLFTNCRNTRKIAEFNSKITDYELNELLKEGGEDVSVINYDKEENFKNEIVKLVKKLNKEKVRLDDVVFLSPKKYQNSQLKNCLDKVCPINELNDRMIKQKNQPTFATIQGYKGLDAKVVILVDTDKIFDHNFSKYMYISISRARAKLYVMVDEKIYKERIIYGI